MAYFVYFYTILNQITYFVNLFFQIYYNISLFFLSRNAYINEIEYEEISQSNVTNFESLDPASLQ